MLTHSIGWRFQTSFSKTRRNISPQQSRARVMASTSTSCFDVVAFERACSDDDGEEPSFRGEHFFFGENRKHFSPVLLKKTTHEDEKTRARCPRTSGSTKTCARRILRRRCIFLRDRKIEPPIQHHQRLHGVFSFSENASSRLDSRRA